MSTFYFNNKHNIQSIKEDIDFIISNNDSSKVQKTTWAYEDLGENLQEETIEILKEVSETLQNAYFYVFETDKLLSHVIDEEIYVKRIKEVMNEQTKKITP